MADTEAEQSSKASGSAPVFKKRSSRPKATPAIRSFVGEEDEEKASRSQATSNSQEEEEQRLSLEELIALRAMRVKPSGIELDRLNKGEVRKKKKKKQEEKVGETEEDRWAQQMQKGGLVVRSAAGGAGERGKSRDRTEEEEDDDEDEEDSRMASAAPRLVKQNNFQGETGTVDVDKHMMAYIEEEMKKRRQRGELDGSAMSDADKAKAMLNPDDELYSVDDKYRKILQSAKEALEAAKKNVNGGVREKQKDDQEEGNATLSSAMLNGVPEVDLGMNHRMKNIEETERAKRAMMEAQRVKKRDGNEEEEGDFASARCEYSNVHFCYQSF